MARRSRRNRCPGGRLLSPYTARIRVRSGGRDRARESLECGRAGKRGERRKAGLSVSADGRFVAFASNASNLVEDDTNRMMDVFVRDRQIDVTERVSIASDGTQANSFSYDASISADGRFVAFQSFASNLVPDDTNGMGDIFVHDRETGTTERVSIGCGDSQANGACWGVRISADGRFVAFDSEATNLVADDTNEMWDVFVHDRVADAVSPTTKHILKGTRGQNGWYISYVEVAFEAEDNEGGTGVALTEYSFDGENWSTYGGPFMVTTEGLTTVYYRSTDNAGNIESPGACIINIDVTPPLARAFSPFDNAVYPLNQEVTAEWLAADTMSGIATEVATVPYGMPLDTSSVGEKRFTVEAVDNAGNRVEETVTYYVRYNFSIITPIGAASDNTYKRNSPVQVQFKLFDGLGNSVDSASARLYLTKVNNGEVGAEIEANAVGKSNDGNLFKYRAEDNLYVFKLDTKELHEGTWQLHIELDDGSSHYADIELR